MIEPPRSSAKTCERTALVLILLGVSLMPRVAVADDDDPYDRPGLYVGISGVYQRNVLEGELEDLLEDAADPFDAELSIEETGGLNALIGYRVASWWAAELQWEWMDEYDVEGTVDPLPQDNVYSISGHSLMLNTK
jgi:hypothetical protein